jgi:hypothetical protein
MEADRSIPTEPREPSARPPLGRDVVSTGAHHEDTEVFKEAVAMALYVAIYLLAEMAAIPDPNLHDDLELLGVVWGTAFAIAIAHWFAFRVAARLVSEGRVRRSDERIAGAHLAGAGLVALLATVPVLVLPASAQRDVIRLLLAGFAGLAGYEVGRTSGASTRRSLLLGLGILATTLTIAAVKNILGGH